MVLRGKRCMRRGLILVGKRSSEEGGGKAGEVLGGGEGALLKVRKVHSCHTYLAAGGAGAHLPLPCLSRGTTWSD